MTQHYLRRVIQIQAVDSPNVARGLWLKEQYPQLSEDEIEAASCLVPGVLGYKEYWKRRRLWDRQRQAVGLDAVFYVGPELMLFPPDWLEASAQYAARVEAMVRQGMRRVAKALGVDPGEGEANTAWSVVDEHGLIEQIAYQTSDTTVINDQTIALARKHNVPDDQWAYDRGGGGKQLADALRRRGYKGVRTIGFGESVVLEPKRGMRVFGERLEQREDRYAYFNRRAQMYGDLSNLMDPSLYASSQEPGAAGSRRPLPNGSPFSQAQGRMGLETPAGFGIPRHYVELRRQLSKIPKRYDEGRLRLPPKSNKDPESSEVTLVKLIGHSPDEADSLVVGNHVLLHRPTRASAGAGA